MIDTSLILTVHNAKLEKSGRLKTPPLTVDSPLYVDLKYTIASDGSVLELNFQRSLKCTKKAVH